MSEQSDAVILSKLEQLASNDRESSVAQGRLLQEVSGVRGEVAKLALDIVRVDEKASRALSMAAAASRAAEDVKAETTSVHKAWQVHAEALRLSVEGVKAETSTQTTQLNKLVAAEAERAKADDDQRRHRQWQREQADAAKAADAEAEVKREKRRKTITWILGTAIAVSAIIGSLWVALKVLWALTAH